MPGYHPGTSTSPGGEMSVSMYERYGGFPAIRRLVSAFYDLVLDSPVVSHHFTHVDMARLVDHQTRFVSFLLDGPASFGDDHLRRVHADLGITPREFDEAVELMREALEDHGFTPADTAQIIDRMRGYAHLIVTAR